MKRFLMVGLIAVIVLAGCTSSNGTSNEENNKSKAQDCGNDLIKGAPCFSEGLTQCTQGTKMHINAGLGTRYYEILGLQNEVCRIRVTTEMGLNTVEQECDVEQTVIENLAKTNTSNCKKTGQT